MGALILRTSQAVFALALAGVLGVLAIESLQPRITAPPSPVRSLQVPAWVDLGPQPDSRSEEYHCDGGPPRVFPWEVRVTNGRLDARPIEPWPRDDELPYDLELFGVLDGPLATDALSLARHKAWATTYARESARYLVEPVVDGWLVGFDGGEYGGSLWWYPELPGTGRKLHARNVQAMTTLPGGRSVLVFTGLAHMGMADGQVLKLERDSRDRRWRVTSVRDLLGTPRTALLVPEGILVATTRSVELVSIAGEPRVLADVAPLRMTYASSLAAAPGGEIIVGTYHLVVVFRPREDGYSAQWYAPIPCPAYLEQGR